MYHISELDLLFEVHYIHVEPQLTKNRKENHRESKTNDPQGAHD